MTPAQRFCNRFGWSLKVPDGVPFAIAHRGASDYALENTLKAFRAAHELGAEMWELDVRMAACGTVVVCHDADLQRLAGDARLISETSYADLKQVKLADGEWMPTVEAVIELAEDTGAGLYIELKDDRAGPATWQLLKGHSFKHAIIGAFDPGWMAALRTAGCEWPLSVLVPLGVNPLDHAAPASPDLVHLCWEHSSDRPDRLVTDELIDAIEQAGAETVLWHEERLPVVRALLHKPVLGICSNRPEMLKPARHTEPTAYVCHRGANAFAPENTLEAARICFDQGFDFVEIDVRTSKDGHLVVVHDATLERTTNGIGLVSDHTLDELRALDAGRWYGDSFKGAVLPTLDEVLALARTSGGALYIEIKQASPREILNAVTAAHMLDRVFFWGSDVDALEWLRAQSTDIQLMATRGLYTSVQEAHEHYRAQIIEFDVRRDDLNEVEICRSMGLKSMIYSQTDEWETLASYRKHRPDLVNLDRPDRFKLITDFDWLER